MLVPNAFVSGVCASLASVFGKLSGADFNFLDYKLAIALKLTFFSLMVISNGVMWTFFVKALQSSKSSLQATVLSSGTNYFLSGLLGFLIFKEVTGLLWWTGISLVLTGLLLINSSSQKSAKD